MRRQLREAIDGRVRALVRLGLCKNLQEAKARADTTMRCNAKTRKGTPCQARGFGKGGRCKLHGGASTGPRTPEGKARPLAAAREGFERWKAKQAPGVIAELTLPDIPGLMTTADLEDEDAAPATRKKRPSPDNTERKTEAPFRCNNSAKTAAAFRR